MLKVQIASDPVQAKAQRLLSALKMEEAAEQWVKELAEMEYEALCEALPTDDLKTAFWVNVYNGMNLYKMRNSAPMTSHKERLGHFTGRNIRIAGKVFSLMDIENGILRRSKPVWGLGYISKLFPSRTEKELRVDQPDPRIHFALNCGAESCPPIRFYTADAIEEQLEIATRAYLSTEIKYDADENPDEVKVSSLFRMYPGDFGGRRGARQFIRKYRADLPNGKRLKWHFIKWDSTPNLTKFAT